MYKQKHIQDLVSKLYFLPWEESQKILRGVEGSSEAYIDKLFEVLNDAI